MVWKVQHSCWGISGLQKAEPVRKAIFKSSSRTWIEINFCLSSTLSDFFLFFSLHIRSMWETICDAWACWSGWKFGANSTEYPYSVIQNTPPPPKLEFRQILGLWVFSITEYPPPARSSEWETMCSKLPHVETLSNPNNYSFFLWHFVVYHPAWSILSAKHPSCLTA